MKEVASVLNVTPRTVAFHKYLMMAQLKIGMAEEFLRKGPVNPKDPFPALHDIGKSDLALFNKYFHSDKQSKAIQLQQLQRVRHMYDSMQTVLTHSLLQAPMFGWGVGYFQPDPADGTLAAVGRRQAAAFGRRQLLRRQGPAAGHDLLSRRQAADPNGQLPAGDHHP